MNTFFLTRQGYYRFYQINNMMFYRQEDAAVHPYKKGTIQTSWLLKIVGKLCENVYIFCCNLIEF